MVALFAAYATFFAGFEQGGASLNLFAERYTDRHVFGWEMPAGVLQGATAFYTILFAPRSPPCGSRSAAAARTLRPRPSSLRDLRSSRRAISCMYVASGYVVAGVKVLPTWLLVAYFLQECGDLCLSPVGLSSMTKLAPPRFVGPGDGNVVPRARARQQPRRSALGRVRRARPALAAGAVPQDRLRGR